MNHPALQLFDRSLTLGDLLAPAAAARIAQAVAALLGTPVRLLDMEGEPVCQTVDWPGDGDVLSVPLCLQLDTVGFLEAASPLARLRAAGGIVEELLQAAARYCMAADLHVEAVRSDYERLQEEHATLLASEARYRELSHTLEQRVQEQVQTIEDSQRNLYQTERLAAVGQLAAGVAHEINNPLGFIRSNLNTARQYTQRLAALRTAIAADAGSAWRQWQSEQLTELFEDYDALLTECIGGADRVAKIVSDLKTFSSLDRGEVVPTDLNENLRVVCSVAEGQLPEGARIECDLQPLPLFRCEAARVNQMFLNVLLNSVQAIAPGGKVVVSSALLGGQIRIAFQDDGCGMPREVLARVFDPFFTTRPVGSGTGLGLTVTRDIVRGYGGMLDIRSEPGEGTQVSIRLPLQALS